MPVIVTSHTLLQTDEAIFGQGVAGGFLADT